MSKHNEMLPPTHEFRHLVTARKVGESGVMQTVEATAEERARIAAFLDIIELTQVRCEFRITRWRARGIKVSGALEAVAVQACVVTLEAVEERIGATFERRFLPPDMLDETDDPGEVLVDPEGEDPPEPMTAEIDLGEIVVEEIALNLNPYPRQEGTSFPAAGTDPPGAVEIAREKPFAALAKLKLKPRNKP